MIAGRYTLKREIGRGGAGVVHLGHDEVLGREVAIKRMGLLPGTTVDDVARAEREARLAAGINHQHVVSILDLVKDEDCYWLVMEHVVGRTLSELIVTDGPLVPTARAAGIIAQAADGLVEAHKAGIVHRDVKPSNIMVDDNDHAKLGDFGIARSADDAALTRTGLVTGSPAYIAPEVASGSNASAASDVWSLGATLHHALTGKAPYDMGQNVLGGLYRIVHDDPPRLPIDHPLAAVLAGMLQKDPGQRWSVVKVRDALRRVARDDSGAGVRDSPDDRSDRSATVTMGAVPAASVAPAVAHPESTEFTRSPLTTRSALPLGRLAAAVALVLLVGLGAWLWWPGADGSQTAADPSDSAQTQEPSASAKPTTDPTTDPTADPTTQPTTDPTAEPTTDPTTDPTTPPTNDAAAPAGGAAAMEAFVQNYFSQVTSDPASTYAMLTPQFQAESGGYGRYSGFWSTIRSASTTGLSADAKALTVSYTIQYVATSGRATTQQGRLQLRTSGDSYLIAGEG